jgi:hypothetical protein
MTTDVQNNQQPQTMSLNDHVVNQKNAFIMKANELVGVAHNIVDSWAQNFIIIEKIKSVRTEQLNQILGFISQLANEGLQPLNQIGNETKDPELSSKLLECNNTLMTVAQNIVKNTQQQENDLQAEIQKLTQMAQNNQPKTEVKVQES